MSRVWAAGLAAVAVAVFALAGYVLVHDDPVHRAGRMPRLPVAATISSSGTSASTSNEPPPVVAYVGDDWTAGVGASDRDHRFTTLLSAALGVQGRNFGVPNSGYAKQGGSGGDYADRVADVVAAQPAMVVVCGGRNDVPDDLRFLATRARRLFEQLRSRLPGAVVVATAPMWGDSAPPAALGQVAHTVKLAARGAGVHYLDLDDPLLGHPSFMADDTHPDDQGYAAIATALRPLLKRLVPS